MPSQTRFLYFVSIPLNFLFLFSDSLTEKPNFYILFSIGFPKDAGMYSCATGREVAEDAGLSYQSRNAHLSTMFMKKEDTNEFRKQNRK